MSTLGMSRMYRSFGQCPLCRAKVKVPIKDLCKFYARSHETDEDLYSEITSSEISDEEPQEAV